MIATFGGLVLLAVLLTTISDGGGGGGGWRGGEKGVEGWEGEMSGYRRVWYGFVMWCKGRDM